MDRLVRGAYTPSMTRALVLAFIAHSLDLAATWLGLALGATEGMAVARTLLNQGWLVTAVAGFAVIAVAWVLMGCLDRRVTRIGRFVLTAVVIVPVPWNLWVITGLV